jgi:hemerythrin
MSVRAYRVNKIDFEKSETFNLWHDEFVRDFFEGEGFFESFSDSGGIGDISVEALKELSGLLAEKIEKEKDKEYWQSLKESIDKDITWAEERGEACVVYYCF